jgi:2-oxoglutarate ferredoxin oxidoreductase subunit alpha
MRVVTGKDVFPSNIQGLPTWYEIRVSKTATRRVGTSRSWWRLNTSTTPRTSPSPPGGIYRRSSWPLDDALVREGTTILGIPFRGWASSRSGRSRANPVANIAYAARCADEIDMDIIGGLRESSRRSAARRELHVHSAGYDYARRSMTFEPFASG